MQEMERWVGNGLATLLTISALIVGAVGMLIAFGIFWDDESTAHFQDGLVWLTFALILVLAGHAFRREHSIADVRAASQQKSGESGWRRVDEEPRGGGQRIGSRAR